MVRLLCTFFIILIIVSCKKSTSLSENEKKIVIESVRQTLENYYLDIKKSGLTAEFNYLDSSPEFFWVPPGYSNAISFDSVFIILTQNAPLYKSIENSFDTLLIHPLNKELATYTGRLRSTITDTSGKIMTVSLIETGILIKRSVGWKLLSGQTTVLNQ